MGRAMRGRDLFARFSPVIGVIVRLLRLLPHWFRLFLWALVNNLAGFIGVGTRYCLLASLVESCGSNVYVGKNVEIRCFENLSIGNNVSIHHTCFLDASGQLSIGNDVSIAHQSSIVTSEHTWSDVSAPIRDNPVALSKVAISDDAWIGCGSRILSGVSVGSRTVVGAGAVVVKDVESATVVGGVPAKIINRI